MPPLGADTAEVHNTPLLPTAAVAAAAVADGTGYAVGRSRHHTDFDVVVQER